jgi:hypothetical protein
MSASDYLHVVWVLEICMRCNRSRDLDARQLLSDDHFDLESKRTFLEVVPVLGTLANQRYGSKVGVKVEDQSSRNETPPPPSMGKTYVIDNDARMRGNV